jgi:hypothetical protein
LVSGGIIFQFVIALVVVQQLEIGAFHAVKAVDTIFMTGYIPYGIGQLVEKLLPAGMHAHA